MQNRQRVWFWLATAVLFVVGIMLVMNDSGAGWFLIILGTAYVGVSTRASEGLVASKPRLARWGFIGATLLLAALTIVGGAALLVR